MGPSATDGAAPPRDRARGLLRECRALSERLLETVDAHSSGRLHKDLLAPEQVMGLLVEKQRELRDLVEEIHEHQKIQQVIEKVRHAIAEEDAKLAHLSACLRGAEASLQDALDETRPRVAALHRSNKGYIDVDDVVAYAGKISASLSAPPNWDPSTPLGKYLPPAPPDEMMRSGRLAALRDELGDDQALPSGS